MNIFTFDNTLGADFLANKVKVNTSFPNPFLSR